MHAILSNGSEFKLKSEWRKKLLNQGDHIDPTQPFYLFFKSNI